MHTSHSGNKKKMPARVLAAKKHMKRAPWLVQSLPWRYEIRTHEHTHALSLCHADSHACTQNGADWQHQRKSMLQWPWVFPSFCNRAPSESHQTHALFFFNINYIAKGKIWKNWSHRAKNKCIKDRDPSGAKYPPLLSSSSIVTPPLPIIQIFHLYLVYVTTIPSISMCICTNNHIVSFSETL